MSSREQSFLARVRRVLPALHPAERRLGEFVCDFPGDLASYSASELAAFADVSKATVSRFVQRIGYENYEAARRHARAEKETGSQFFLATFSGERADHPLQAHVAQSAANLEATFLAITERDVDAVARAMLEARKVWVIGFRSGHPFASYMHWHLMQVLEHVAAVPGTGQTLGEHIVGIAPEDVVVVFGLRRRVARTNLMLQQIARRNAALLYISDEGAPAVRGATWHFRCHTATLGTLFNHVSVMAACHLLISRTMELAGSGGRARLRDIESLNDGLEEL